MADEAEVEAPTSVRDDLLAAMKEHEEPAGAEPEVAAPARDESGRFAAKEKDDASARTRETDTGGKQPARAATGSASAAGEGAVPAAASAESAAGGSLAAQGSGASATVQAGDVSAAPSSWTNAAKAEWAKLPPVARAEIAKREQEIHREFTRRDDERNYGREIQKVVQPYEAIIRAAGSTPQAAIADVLNTAYILRTADPVTKARTMAQVIQQYGVDLKLAGTAQAQNVDPTIAALQQEVAQLRSERTREVEQQRAQVEQEVLTAVETFGQDPKHPHFRAVSAHMGALMQAGQAKDMEEAYEMAVWARPDIRGQLQAAQTAQATAQGQTRQKAQNARAKGVSVRGGPGGYTPPVTNPNASVRESLMAAMTEVNERL